MVTWRLKTRFFVFIVFIAFVLSGVCIYYGVASYYTVSRNENLSLALKAIENNENSKAISFLRRAYQQGNLEALEYLTWLECSRGNYESALNFAREATKQNLPSSFEVMGDLAILGYGEATGVEAALSYFSQGSKLIGGDQNLLISGMIGRALHLVQKDKDYRKLVRAGVKYNTPEAFLRLGDMFFLGDGLSVNPNGARTNWEAAQKLGVNEANTRLAGLYFYGYGVEQNIDKAILLYEKAADKNDPVANYSLGLINLRTNSQEKDTITKAIDYFVKASSLDFAPACSALGFLTVANLKDASKEQIDNAGTWFKKAYEHRGEAGSIIYALMQASGVGAEQNYDHALSILYDEAQLGSVSAKKILSALSKKADPIALLSEALSIAHAVIVGDIGFSAGAPEAHAYHESTRQVFNYYKGLTDIKGLEKIGKNFPYLVDSTQNVTINDRVYMVDTLGGIVVLSMPSTGAQHFVLTPSLPTPLPPKTPEWFESGRELDLSSISSSPKEFQLYP